VHLSKNRYVELWSSISSRRRACTCRWTSSTVACPVLLGVGDGNSLEHSFCAEEAAQAELTEGAERSSNIRHETNVE